MIIEIVGVDGSGKTTVIHKLRKMIMDQKSSWAYERPFQSESVRLLEAAVSTSTVRARPSAAFDTSTIEVARTLDLISKSYQLKTYEKSYSQHVFCDSYIIEQAARLVNHNLDDAHYWNLLALATAPDICIYLEIGPEEALRRMRSRLKGDSILLSENPLSATRSIIDGMEKAINTIGYPVINVDASKDEETVFLRIKSELLRHEVVKND